MEGVGLNRAVLFVLRREDRRSGSLWNWTIEPDSALYLTRYRTRPIIISGPWLGLKGRSISISIENSETVFPPLLFRSIVRFAMDLTREDFKRDYFISNVIVRTIVGGMKWNEFVKARAISHPWPVPSDNFHFPSIIVISRRATYTTR